MYLEDFKCTSNYLLGIILYRKYDLNTSQWFIVGGKGHFWNIQYPHKKNLTPLLSQNMVYLAWIPKSGCIYIFEHKGPQSTGWQEKVI